MTCAWFACLGWSLSFQALPVTGQEPSSGSQSTDVVEFDSASFGVSREGYFKLNWKFEFPDDVEGSYHVYETGVAELPADATVAGLEGEDVDLTAVAEFNPTSRLVYQGTLPVAFVSGLSDGIYRYEVHAMDDSGQVIAKSGVPATVAVMHWPLEQAAGLLIIGAIVFLAVVVVIASGTRRYCSDAFALASTDSEVRDSEDRGSEPREGES